MVIRMMAPKIDDNVEANIRRESSSGLIKTGRVS